MMRSIGAGVSLLLALAWVPGCAQKPPVVVYEPPIVMSDLAEGLTTPENTFELLSDAETTGRFACALAIAKFTPYDGDNGLHLVFEASRPSEQAYWTEQLRGVTAIRELIFLSPVTARPDGPTVENLCATAERLAAPLLLVYAPNGLGPNSAQVLGVLYETATQQPLATLHAASRILDDKGVEMSPNEERGDQREIDARYQAQRAFEGHLLACLRELIHSDTPAPTTQPHRWRKPLVERWWIPQRR